MPCHHTDAISLPSTAQFRIWNFLSCSVLLFFKMSPASSPLKDKRYSMNISRLPTFKGSGRCRGGKEPSHVHCLLEWLELLCPKFPHTRPFQELQTLGKHTNLSLTASLPIFDGSAKNMSKITKKADRREEKEVR